MAFILKEHLCNVLIIQGPTTVATEFVMLLLL